MKLRGMSLKRESLRDERGRVKSSSIASRILRFIRTDCDGAALVEAAIALPVYLIIITGMISTVMAIGAYQKLSYATFTAAQAIGVGRGQITDPCATAASQVTSSLPGWTAANFTYTVWITEDVGGVVSAPKIFGPFTGTAAATCTGVYTSAGNGNYALYNAQNEPVRVQVSYLYTWFPVFRRAISTGNLVVDESTIVN